MTQPIARDPMYRKRIVDAQVLELCVRWYVTYRLSYRDLVPGWRKSRDVRIGSRAASETCPLNPGNSNPPAPQTRWSGLHTMRRPDHAFAAVGSLARHEWLML